jgi:hypothetical protein
MTMPLQENHATEHYLFHYDKDSPAAGDIAAIADFQEKCHTNIMTALNKSVDLSIHYTFFDNPFDCGKLYRSMNPEAFAGDTPVSVNGFAWYPDQVYATYNEKIKAIGHHEVVHLVMYQLNGQIVCRLLTEGACI